MSKLLLVEAIDEPDWPLPPHVLYFKLIYPAKLCLYTEIKVIVKVKCINILQMAL